MKSREPSSIVLSNRLSMCQRLRSWKRSLRRFRPHMNECNSEPSSIVLSNRLSMCQRLRSWKRSSRRVRPHMNECNSEPSSIVLSNRLSSPQILEEMSRRVAPQERVQQRTVEHQSNRLSMCHHLRSWKIVEVGSAPHERVQQRTVEQQIVDAVPHSQPQILKEVVEVVKQSKMSLRSVFQVGSVNRSLTTSFPSINQTKLAATHRPVVMPLRFGLS